MEQSQHQILIVGLPETGKTSFIHALDDLLQNPPTPTSLRSDGLAPDRSYLEIDKENFRAGRKLVHTHSPKEAPPELWFEDPHTQGRGRLFIPDLRGEVFQFQWIDRKWTKAFGDDLSKVCGALVFVRADVPASNQELLGALITMARSTNELLPWDPKKASPQVQLVEVLQFIAIKGRLALPLKTAVLISAWDTVEKPDNLQPKTPNAFLEREWPLLDQYLRANPGTFVTKIYGVSALGGTEAELKELSKSPPQDRVKLVEEQQSSQDLTRPLRWLLELD
jgi:hypothetical protein